MTKASDTVAEFPSGAPGEQGEERSRNNASVGRQTILGLPVSINVSVGRAKLTIEELLHLSAGQIVDLNSRVSDLVEIYVGERMVARGELIEQKDAPDALGIRITEICHGAA